MMIALAHCQKKRGSSGPRERAKQMQGNIIFIADNNEVKVLRNYPTISIQQTIKSKRQNSVR